MWNSYCIPLACERQGIFSQGGIFNVHGRFCTNVDLQELFFFKCPSHCLDRVGRKIEPSDQVLYFFFLSIIIVFISLSLFFPSCYDWITRHRVRPLRHGVMCTRFEHSSVLDLCKAELSQEMCWWAQYPREWGKRGTKPSYTNPRRWRKGEGRNLKLH